MLLYPWGFSMQEYWSGLPCPPPEDLPNPGVKPRSHALQVDSLPSEPPKKPKNTGVGSLSLLQGIFPMQDGTQVSRIAGGFFIRWATSTEDSGLVFLFVVCLHTTLWLHFHFSLSCIGEGNGNPLQRSCLENPGMGEPGGLPSMGSHRVGHDWSDLAAAAAATAS